MLKTSRHSALATLSCLPWLAHAQTAAPSVIFPNKNIRLVVPYPPGGGNDLLARGVKAQWEKAWDQTVIVDNKPGANGALGTELGAVSVACAIGWLDFRFPDLVWRETAPHLAAWFTKFSERGSFAATRHPGQ